MIEDYVYSPKSREDEIRWAAIDWLRQRTLEGELPLTREDILDFRLADGDQFRLQDLTKGIRRPRGWGAALSVTTSFKPKKQFAIYEDHLGADGLWHYSWEKGGPDVPTNAGLRVAYENQLPLIGFLGVGGKPPLYQVVSPVRVAAWLPREERVVLAPIEHGATLGERREQKVHMEQIFREYLSRETKVRVHQPFFRQLVLRAYEGRCAMCSLGHLELLDAAHIIPDAEGGAPSVTNGLALCKIHHAAYDRRFIGVDADYRIHVRPALLQESDGPMLEHGLKQLEGLRLRTLPKARAEQPDRDALGHTFNRYLEAASSRR
ncbi:HNH endonuclease [Galactobacter valiniphilus]|uniref:HNH endonuclease n=1 Tax=Galactobacter valiniphilus TaxID=2676122 RepID=UPI0037369A8D